MCVRVCHRLSCDLRPDDSPDEDSASLDPSLETRHCQNVRDRKKNEEIDVKRENEKQSRKTRSMSTLELLTRFYRLSMIPVCRRSRNYRTKIV